MAQVEPLACAPGHPSLLTFKEVCWTEWGLTLVTTFHADISIPKPTVSTPARLDWILGLLELSRVPDCKQSLEEPY